MIPLLKTGNRPQTAEDTLENVSTSLQQLELLISAYTRFHSDDDIPSDEFNAIMNGLHLQVYELCQEIKKH